MNINRKITLAVSVVVVITTLAAIATVFFIARSNRVSELHSSMSTILTQATQVRDRLEVLHRAKAIDMQVLAKQAAEQFPGKKIREIYPQTTMYKAIPIVATWESIAKVAESKGYSFQIVARPDMPARNEKYKAGPGDEPLFEKLKAGANEVFSQDPKTNELVLAQAVRLTAGCMDCHGSEKNSATKDGLDPLGFKMENMKEGDLKAAFVLRAPMTNDHVVMKSIAQISLVGVIILVITMAGFVYFNRTFIIRPLSLTIHRLTEVASETSAAADEISSSAHTLAEGATEQAASLEESSASLEEMAGMTNQTTENAQSAKSIANLTRQAAETGATDMQQMLEAMDTIQKSANSIDKIVKSIDEIAFQTNILALNAAVEAARAGEAGAGFAVVADEVRSLAQRSAGAARETASMIEDSIQKSRRGAEISGKVASSFQDIVAKAREVDRIVAEIAEGANEQKLGIGQINTSVSGIDKITQSNAAAAEETSAAAEQMRTNVQSLRASLLNLETLTGNAADNSGSSAAARGGAGRGSQADDQDADSGGRRPFWKRLFGRHS